MSPLFIKIWDNLSCIVYFWSSEKPLTWVKILNYCFWTLAELSFYGGDTVANCKAIYQSSKQFKERERLKWTVTNRSRYGQNIQIVFTRNHKKIEKFISNCETKISENPFQLSHVKNHPHILAHENFQFIMNMRFI